MFDHSKYSSLISNEFKNYSRVSIYFLFIYTQVMYVLNVKDHNYKIISTHITPNLL